MNTDSTSHPVWSAPPESPHPFPTGQRFDVCVVGAGIAGLSTAYCLARAGSKVLVVDDGPIGGGMTHCTTAHLSSALDDRFAELEKVRGRDACRLAAASHAAAIDAIEDAVTREWIDCGFRRVDGYLFPFRPPDEEIIRQEAEAAGRAGLEVDLLPRAPLPGGETGLCLRFRRQGQVEPVAYLRGLARAAEGLGATLVTGVHVKSIEDGTPVRITTADGRVVTAGAAVVATNSPVNDRFALHTKQYPYLTYVIALRMPADAIPTALYWDTGDPYHYARTATGPDGDELLIVGGEDHKTGQASNHAERFARLEDWARHWVPAAGAVTHRWSGQVLETIDGLGFIGRNPGERHVYVATGDSGMGMTHGTIAGLLLTDLILGRANAWEELYEPSRKPLRAISEFASENLNAAAQYTAYFTGGDVSSIDDVPAGHGAVVRDGLTKLAVYRDDDGTVHACSAVCPHLGAVVRWNAAEKTWDCPAHGSRFDCTGRVFQGPANTNLAEAPTATAH
jgi:glycine/D-amino acid oxidase-like deaminating enzyme/nitrite reductase/ring-hydroxylating ferredoxin subunit